MKTKSLAQMKNPSLKAVFIFLLILIAPLFSSASEVSKPQIQLANLYHKNINIQNYFVSEKLDGVRAYWNGEKLISREGNIYNAPKWFIKNFPNAHLEGELWIARGEFEQLSGIVRRDRDEAGWENIHFMLFDMPKSKEIFEKRLEEMKILATKSNSKYLQVIEQKRFSSHEELTKHLNEIVKNGGEGLMLHRSTALYEAARNDDLLKLKTFEDDEAIVISHIQGKGKYEGVMGALLVENRDKVRFKIGGGFSDIERKSPPQIGSVITYKFFGKTKNNTPRFASFMRIRHDMKPWIKLTEADL